MSDFAPQIEPQFFEAPALLVEARYRDRALCTRLLAAGAARGFSVGAGRAADAPIDLAYLLLADAVNDNHLLIEPRGAGFLVNLTPAMRACAQATAAGVRIPCGEVIFDITAAAPALAVPRPWLSRRWREGATYLGGVAAALVLLLAIISAVPADPRAISLDDLGRTFRLADFRIDAPVPPPPPPTRGGGAAAGGAAHAPSGPSGAAGTPKARPVLTQRATKGPAERQDARAVEAHVRSNTLLSVLDGQRSTSFAAVLSATPALGSDAQDALGNMVGTEIADAYGHSGFGTHGSGAGDAGEGEGVLGDGHLRTIDGHGHGPGRPGYGEVAGALIGHREVRPIKVFTGELTTRGVLDREIIRRVVRQHLNEVRYCYEQSLVRHPTLAGRVVAQFTIGPTGRVLVSALASSTIPDVAVGACIVEATKRWEFPRPDGGGLASVSYPFQLAPAGG